MVDIEEEEDDDENRRDISGRKRVAVVECLLESSPDEADHPHIPTGKLSNILWLTYNEICHIRFVITQTTLSMDKQCSQILRGKLCYRCRKTINLLYFLPSFFHFTKHETCSVCQQIICEKCSYYRFSPPILKLLIPVRLPTLMKPSSSSSTTIENKTEQADTTNKQTKTICYDCLQVFSEHLKTSQYRIKSPVSPFRRTHSLPTRASTNSNEIRHTRHRRRPVRIFDFKNEITTVDNTSPTTKF
ncbi:unnamed protein product [Adineta steineri]|uniref:Uncharacterized protein n=1 Tax=Adineta steineri TaxID=433720 RepID=A0A815T176_9BILA|nr:unnamed protein product [Adineta steineri]CAF3649121.1 unnamed protein product [Adineta steineri]